MDNQITFGDKIKELREQQKLSLRELAKRIGVSAGYLSQLERNRMLVGLPSEDNIKKIARILYTDETELILLADKLPSEITNLLKESMKNGILTSKEVHDFVLHRRVSQ